MATSSSSEYQYERRRRSAAATYQASLVVAVLPMVMVPWVAMGDSGDGENGAKEMENDGLTDLSISTDYPPRVTFKRCSPRQLLLRELL